MQNLSELGRASPNYSLWHKYRSLRDPDIYIVEDMRDFSENVKSIPFPWYKSPCPHKLFSYPERAYIIIPNVNIESIDDQYFEECGCNSKYFIVRDDTGAKVMYWGGEDDIVNSLESFDTASETQGLKSNDWVYDVFVRYIIKADFPTIVQVRKYNFKNRKPETKTLTERIKEFLPKFLPNPIPTET